MINQTTIAEFLLLGFSDVRELQILHFIAFLFIYLVTLTGNILLIVTVARHPKLYSPMYFFLVNLSFLDANYISTIVPKSIFDSLLNKRQISFSECITQAFWVLTFSGTELFILTVMAYDRYVAICHPLQYRLIMNWNACFQMAAASWVCSSINGLVHTANALGLHFCSSNMLGNFFCDIPQLLALSCTDTTRNQGLLLAVAVFVGSFCFFFVFISYAYIFSAVFKIQSTEARYKAFSTCIPHLTVFSLFISTASFSYLRPKAWSSLPMDMIAVILYTVLPPLMNPIIYSLRNKEIKKCLMKMLKR
ncbi:olfactory receptor 14C36-like [Protobothrops mucrosquamatus]|uniref:olfactory receptor 14C36-like n=1 Tax=Protobothrops mucrosquamatus TaxID=103944 RepID=UPI0010FB7917|nr:olfactory receptor 14C36-like [Protobothrops mucrosquamatus]